MTEDVATQWYHAPEILLSLGNYVSVFILETVLSSNTISPAPVDCHRYWSMGCILAELLGGKPIFKGHK